MEKALLIYDGECPICRRATTWVRAHTDMAAVDLITCQSPERAERAPEIPQEQCMTAMQLVLPDGTVRQGDKAFPWLLQHTPGYGWLGRLMQLPVIRWISPFVYSIIARHRMKISKYIFQDAPNAAQGQACDINHRENCE